MQSAQKILTIIQTILIIAAFSSCFMVSRELMQGVLMAKFFWLSGVMIILTIVTVIKSAIYPPISSYTIFKKQNLNPFQYPGYTNHYMVSLQHNPFVFHPICLFSK